MLTGRFAGLSGEYGEFAECFGEALAAKMFQADITRAKKKDKIRRLKEKLLEMSDEDVGAAYKRVLAAGLESIKPEPAALENTWRAERRIWQILILEMEI